jgi:hypothetical protein
VNGVLRSLVASHVLVFGILLVPVLAKLLWDIPPEDMLRDPAQVMDAPMYTGALSNLGLILWSSTATLCTFFAFVHRELRSFWSYAAGLTLALLLDDWLMLHEIVLPDVFGLPDIIVYAAYALAMLFYLGRFHRCLLLGDWPLLLIALGWFAVSIGLDQLDGVVAIPAQYLWEDGAKLFGIVTWLLFHARLARSFVNGGSLHPGQQWSFGKFKVGRKPEAP